MDVYSMFSLSFLLVPLLIVGAILYFVFRNRGHNSNQGKDAYYYIISFILVMILFWAVSDLFRVILEQMFGVDSTYSSYSYYRSNTNSQEELLRGISMRLSTIIVGFPIWAFHWYKASKKPPAEMDYHSRKSYAFIMMIMTFIGVIGTTVGLVYLGMNALLGVSKDALRALPYLLPYSITGGVLWFTHYQIWKKAKTAPDMEIAAVKQ